MDVCISRAICRDTKQASKIKLDIHHLLSRDVIYIHQIFFSFLSKQYNLEVKKTTS